MGRTGLLSARRKTATASRVSGGVGRAVLGLRQVDGAVVQVNLATRQTLDLTGTHAGVERDTDDPAEHRVGVAIAGPEQCLLLVGPQPAVATLARRRFTDYEEMDFL
jgi:hypothetical protein